MSASNKYETVKKYFEQGMWTTARVKKAVEKGWITEGEYEVITGEKL